MPEARYFCPIAPFGECAELTLVTLVSPIAVSSLLVARQEPCHGRGIHFPASLRCVRSHIYERYANDTNSDTLGAWFCGSAVRCFREPRNCGTAEPANTYD